MKVLVFAEQRAGEFRKAAIEAICAARRLDGDGEVVAVVIGKGIADKAGQLAAYGADKILSIEHDLLDLYSTDGYTTSLQKAVESENPDAVLLAATAMGRDLAPRLGARLDVPVLADVTELSWVDGNLQAVRPVYAGKLMMTVKSNKTPGIATTRPKAFLASEPDQGKTASVTSFDVSLSEDDLKAKVKQIQSEAEGMIELTEADFIVSGGRGMKAAENFTVLEDLAKVLNAAIGASRAAVDSGWRTHSEQVGQTGKVVAPTLYIACGISGAIQHLAGMTSSKVIIAINKDPDAPIFKIADYGIVGDAMEVVPALTEAIKAAK
ncbi:electron transfer flavoprotein subunit alpha [candidate division LCP-89 bacterium B3_LCP]|uniref:Electron transfer flavoprotein subunit alpha n=1 Tax=candidate division LCP-89 bacterium B3_LCP TaxID=2012998 RepID=A0A532UW64_UNCL8|nr:MAG: electron transfer flavoprotein subunit alpha [candidate division LCP-89 bacterium B3_LCP]